MSSCIKWLVLFATVCTAVTSVAPQSQPSPQAANHFRPSTPDLYRQEIETKNIPFSNPLFSANPILTPRIITVSQVRFVDSDDPATTRPRESVQIRNNKNPALETEAPILRTDLPATISDSPAGSRQQKSIGSTSKPASQANQQSVDRWPWPTSSLVELQGRQLIAKSENVAKSDSRAMVIRKSVPRPYRILTKVSSCPKLLHDLTISCQLPAFQHSGQPILFQWAKNVVNNSDVSVRGASSSTNVPVSRGAFLLTKDPRYGVSTTVDSTTLTIRQLKVSDCGTYTCEASSINGTVLYSSELLVFLCF